MDKPYEWTSFDVVNKLRWHLRKKLGVKKLKVGHAGTLDPLATGLLVLCIGKHTKKINDFIQDDKEYTGTILLGKTTPSFDLETEYNAEFDTQHITDELMNEALKELKKSCNEIVIHERRASIAYEDIAEGLKKYYEI